MAEKKHVIEYTDIIKAFEKVKEKLIKDINMEMQILQTLMLLKLNLALLT